MDNYQVVLDALILIWALSTPFFGCKSWEVKHKRRRICAPADQIFTTYKI